MSHKRQRRFFKLCCPANLPQQHHVQRVVGEAGDERRHRDERDDGDEEVPAAVGARRRPGFGPSAGDAAAVGVELHTDTQRG